MEEKTKFSIEDKFKTKNLNYTHFNQIMQKLSKAVETPYNRSGQRKKKYYGLDFTLDEIKEVKKSLDVQTMRTISNNFYKSNTSYKRMVDHFAYLYRYYYTLDLKGISNTKNYTADVKKLYYNVLNLLDNFNIAQTFGDISKKVILNGVYYGYVNVFAQNHAVFTELDPNYCRTCNNSCYGTKIVEFNLSFFNQYKNNEDDLKSTLAKFPEEIQMQWFWYDSGHREDPWIALPTQFSCAFSISENEYPILFDAILDTISYEETKEIEQKKDKDALKKILVQRFDLDGDGDLDILLEEMAQIHEAVSQMLADYDSIDVLTTLAKDVDLKDTQGGDRNITYTNLNKMLQPKYESSGLSTEIFSATGTTSLDRSIENVTSFMSQLIEQYQNWLSMFCYSQFNFQKLIPLVTILPVTWYNEEDMVNLYLKNAQYGFSWILPYVAAGKKQSTIVDSIYLEQDILGLKDKMRPLSSSFTEPGKDGNSGQAGPGRPELPNSEKSAKTIANIESM